MQTVDLCVTSNHVLNVFNRTFEPNILWIENGTIIATGKHPGEYTAQTTIDATNQYVVPGFIDAHVHIESSLLVPHELARVLLPQGTTTIVTDPHEIANVCGTTGLDFMLQDSAQVPLDIITMLPSCVPCAPFEHNGTTLTAKDLKPYYANDRVGGLSEVMDYPAVAQHDPDMMAKLRDCQAAHRQADGHGAGLTRDQLDVLVQNGITTDHECMTVAQAQDRINAGMYLFLREGTVERDLENLIPVVTPANAQRCAFCTDDKLVTTLLDEGGINYCIKRAIHHGIKPATAYVMASYNAAQAHRLTDRGALTPNQKADLVILDSATTCQVAHVIKAGVLDPESTVAHSQPAANTMHVKFDPQQLTLPLKQPQVKVITVQPNHIETTTSVERVTLKDGAFVPNPQKDQLKLAVVERHHARGTVGVAVVKGMHLRHGAVAMSIAHDSHNIIVLGTNDADMTAAIRHLCQIGGGITIFNHEQEVASMPLPVAGLMTTIPAEKAVAQLRAVTTAYQQLSGPLNFDPFLTLSFLALPVIPTLKLTDQGVYDFDQQRFIRIDE